MPQTQDKYYELFVEEEQNPQKDLHVANYGFETEEAEVPDQWVVGQGLRHAVADLRQFSKFPAKRN